jgi:flagellin-like hook-associated protein FlgL
MTSGKYTVEITAAVSKDQTSYKLTKIGDTSFGDAGSISFNNINLNKQDRGMGAATNSVNVGAASVSNIVTDNTQLVSGAYTVETQVLGGASTTITTDDVYQFRIVDSAQKDVSFAATSGGAASANTTGWRTFYTGSPSATAVSYNTGLGVTIALTATGATTGLDASALTLTSGSFTYTQAGSNYNLLDSMAAKDALTGTYTQANHTLGIKMQSADFGSLKVGESMTFEYIAKGDIKFSLLDGSGAAQVLAQNSTGTVTGSVGYKQAGTSYVSGRGVSMKLAAFDTVKAEGGSNEQAFVYERANQYSVNVSTSSKAGAYMTTINTALDKVTSTLSDLGALMARLTYKEEQAATAQVNVEGAYSRIMNANMAEEQLNASKYTILQQTATAMLAQANAAPQSLLTLFR